MFIYTFAGKVLPERAHVTLGHIPGLAIEATFPDSTMACEAEIIVSNAQLLLVLRSEEPVVDLWTLRNTIEQIVRGIVDSYGYVEGRGYDIEITSVIDSTGECWQVFPIEEAAIQATKNERPVSFDELKILLMNPRAEPYLEQDTFKLGQLRVALGDLRQAIRQIDKCALFCYRAIECIRRCYENPNETETDATRRVAWERMRGELCIARSWIDDIEKASVVERHGGQRTTTGEERSELMIRTWKVIDRFIMSAKLSFEPLSEALLE